MHCIAYIAGKLSRHRDLFRNSMWNSNGAYANCSVQQQFHSYNSDIQRANRNVFQLMLDSIFFLSFVWASVAIAHFSIFVNPAICWQKLARCIPPDEYLWCTVHLSKQIFCSLSGNERPNALFSRDPFFFLIFALRPDRVSLTSGKCPLERVLDYLWGPGKGPDYRCYELCKAKHE